MLNIFDIVPEPIIEELEPITKSTPWILGYVAVGGLIVIAVLVIIKLVVKSQKPNKDTK